MRLLDGLGLYMGSPTDDNLILLLLFVAVLLSVLGIGGLIFSKDALARRLGYRTAKTSPTAVKVSIRTSEPDQPVTGIERFFVAKGEKWSRQQEYLSRAGYRGPAAVYVFQAARIGLGLALPILAVVLLPIIVHGIPYRLFLLGGILLSIVGFLLPGTYVDRRIRARREAVRLGFPDALDMLLICVEAGLGLDAALNRMAVEIGHAHPIIANEFLLVGAELRAGKNRIDVLRDMAKRVNVDEVAAFVTVLNHSERFGTSIADSLRVYAAEMRAKRMVRAEEKANQLPVKLSLAVAFCTVPAMCILILAPAIVTIARGLAQLIQRT